MKTLKTYYRLLFVLTVLLVSCDDEDYQLDPDFVSMGNLESPSESEVINVDPENGQDIMFSWSPAKTADGGAVYYTIKFDEEGGDFSDPLYSSVSNNGGAATTFNMSHSRLNVLAAESGIQQLETGKIIWTVEATSSYFVEDYPNAAAMSLRRPEGLAIFPDFMYIYGSATEAATLQNAVAFKEISNELPNDNFQPGVFESITKMQPGEFFIVNGKEESVDDFTTYYINEEGKIRVGDEPSEFDMEEAVYRVRMDLAKASITFTKISNIRLYIPANDITKAELQYVGNHTFEATGAYFDFLVPGAPEAPSWLGWEEERYKFKFQLGDDQTSYIGSYQNEGLNGSLVPGLDGYNGRPNGGEPDYYNNIYFLGPDAGYWQGAWKFPDAFNGVPFTVRLVFDPMADHYYHEIIVE